MFRRRRFFQGRPLRVRGRDRLPDIAWFRPDGGEMTDADWEVGYANRWRSSSTAAPSPIPTCTAGPIVDDSFYLIFNGWDQEIDFTLPGGPVVTVVDRRARHRRPRHERDRRNR